MKDLLSILIASVVVSAAIYYIVKPVDIAAVVIEPDMSIRRMPQEYFIVENNYGGSDYDFNENMDEIIPDDFIKRYDASYAATHSYKELKVQG